MKKVFGAVSALAVGLGVVALPSNAYADPVTTEVCSPAALGVCGTASFWLSNANELNFLVYNGSSVVSSLAQLYIFNAPAGMTMGSISLVDWNGTLQSVGAAPAGWTWSTSGSQGWMVNFSGEIDGPSGNGGVTSCTGTSDANHFQTCTPGEDLFGPKSDYLWVKFILAGGGLVDEDLFNIGWGYHAQMLSGSPGSVKCVSDPKYTKSDPHEHDCITTLIPDDDDSGTPQEVVPEPATMTLLATGLAGLAAARRRRKSA